MSSSAVGPPEIRDLLVMEDRFSKMVEFDIVHPPSGPPVQERARMRVLPPSGSCTTPRHVMYDPSSTPKRQLKAAVRAALEAVGVTTIPLFNEPSDRLMLKVRFGMTNVLQKDTSNMLKFIEDAFEGVLYHNDRVLVAIMAVKVQSAAPLMSHVCLESIDIPGATINGGTST